MKWEQFIRDYLQFTQKERIGVLTILFLVFVIIFLPKMVSRKTSSEHIDADTAWISAVKQLEIKEHDPGSQQGDNNKTYQFDHPKTTPVSLFYFSSIPIHLMMEVGINWDCLKKQSILSAIILVKVDGLIKWKI
jgi:hypothetical protein